MSSFGPIYDALQLIRARRAFLRQRLTALESEMAEMEITERALVRLGETATASEKED